MTVLRDPPFETWLAAAFDPAARDDQFYDWYWRTDDDVILSPGLAAAHCLRFLEEPGRLLEMHHDNQVASGLAWMFDPGCGGDSRLFGEPGVPQETRLAIAARLDRIYAELIVPRTPEVLGHRSEEGGRLAGLGYMFWDVVHIGLPGHPRERREMEAALIEALGRILALPHAVAQEGALHGLGHMRDLDPARAAALIDAFLREGRARRPELVTYAQGARTGCIL